MVQKIILVSTVMLICIGCNSSSETGDNPEGRRAADAAPKSAAQLPAEMPPEAKASAKAAIGQASAMERQNNDAARVHALQMMQQQKGQ